MTEKIVLDHGSGGLASHQLIEQLFLQHFTDGALLPLEDSALLEVDGRNLAFSTDSYVVDPIFFPGGDIGDLAVNGTVNDLAMRGATPLFLSVGLILEEGLPLTELERIVRSMRRRAEEAGVRIVTGDTKVVPAGKADKIFINTSGIGLVPPGMAISASNGRAGDLVLLSGTMADHGVTVLCQREGLRIGGSFQSDSAPLNGLVADLLAECGSGVHVLRDPTRGGVATTLNELARSSGIGIRIFEERLPLRPEVKGACELLGLDPLYLANEGKFLALVAPDCAQEALAVLQRHPYGREARLIGETLAAPPARVTLRTVLGTDRVVDMLHGQPLPRIC